MKRLFDISLAAAVGFAAAPAWQEFAAPVTVREVALVEVVDGDTYDVAETIRHRVRLANADTWESRRVRRSSGDRTVSDEELAKGKRAKEQVEAKLRAAGRLLLVSRPRDGGTWERDNFGRVLGEVKADGADVGAWLKANGHTRTP